MSLTPYRRNRYIDEFGRTWEISVGHPRARIDPSRQNLELHQLLARALDRGRCNRFSLFVLGLYDALDHRQTAREAEARWHDPHWRHATFPHVVRALERLAATGSLILEPVAPIVASELPATPDTEPDLPDVPADEATWFEIALVDEVGDPVAGASLRFGRASVVRTNGQGLARLDEQLDSMTDVALEAAPSVYEALAPRWVVPRARELPEGELAHVTGPDEAGQSWKVLHGRRYTWALLPPGRQARFIELHDALFRSDSAVPMPAFMATPQPDAVAPTTMAHVLALALRFNDEHQPKKLLVAGHTDTSGSREHNAKLSRARGECVTALLLGRRDRFAALADVNHEVADAKQWLAWCTDTFPELFACAPAHVDGNVVTLTIPVEKFQAQYNDARVALEVPSATALAVDGDLGPKSWAALFDVFEASLRTELDEPAPEVQTLRGKVQPLASDVEWVGFGEAFPIEAKERDSYRSQSNRRVELVFFDPGEEPNLDTLRTAPEESELYDDSHYQRMPLDAEATARRVLLRVELVDHCGGPIGDAQVQYWTGRGRIDLTTDASGFVERRVVPGEVTVTAPEYEWLWQRPYANHLHDPVPELVQFPTESAPLQPAEPTLDELLAELAGLDHGAASLATTTPEPNEAQ